MVEYDSSSQSGVVTGSLDALSAEFFGYEPLSNSGYKTSTNTIYRARRYGRYYALKGLSPEFRNDPVRREFLSKEYQIGVQLDHPNIVRINSLENDPEIGLCIVMEYVDGMSLDKWLETKPSLANRKQIFHQILEAIKYCHSKQVWHLDLKPSNIIVTKDGLCAKIIDFGLSDNSDFAFKTLGGTRKYAAPEQLNGTMADHRSDIYALGGLLKLLFPHRYKRAIRHAQQSDPEKRPQSVECLSKMMRPWGLLWIIPPILFFALFLFWMHPNGKKFPITLESGQTVYVRVLSHWQRTAALVFPLELNDGITKSWINNPQAPAGNMIIPAHITYRHMPYRVTTIDQGAFNGCKNLTHVIIPEGIEVIAKQAFLGCNHLADTLIIPRSLRIIEGGVFDDCHSLTTLIWKAQDCSFRSDPDNLARFFFRCSSLKKVIVDNSTQNLPHGIFCDMSWLKEVILPNHLQTLPPDMLAYSYGLLNIKLPDSLRELSHGDFYLSNIEHIVIPDRTEIIGPYCFSYCRRLCDIEIGKGVQLIETYAFNYLDSLQTMTLHCEKPPKLMLNALYAIPTSAVLRVPKGSVEKYRNDPGWSIFKTIEEIKSE